jgi:hypothetical protein
MQQTTDVSPGRCMRELLAALGITVALGGYDGFNMGVGIRQHSFWHPRHGGRALRANSPQASWSAWVSFRWDFRPVRRLGAWASTATKHSAWACPAGSRLG